MGNELLPLKGESYRQPMQTISFKNCSNVHEVVYSHNTNTRLGINDKNTFMGLNSIYVFL